MNKIEELENKLKEEKNKMQANLKENYKWVVGKHDNFQRPYFVGFGRQNSATILHRILINAYICIHS